MTGEYCVLSDGDSVLVAVWLVGTVSWLLCGWCGLRPGCCVAGGDCVLAAVWLVGTASWLVGNAS